MDRASCVDVHGMSCVSRFRCSNTSEPYSCINSLFYNFQVAIGRSDIKRKVTLFVKSVKINMPKSVKVKAVFVCSYVASINISD